MDNCTEIKPPSTEIPNSEAKDYKDLLKNELSNENFSKIKEKNLNKLIKTLDSSSALLLCSAYLKQNQECEINETITEYLKMFQEYLQDEKPTEVIGKLDKIYTALRINIEKLRPNIIHILCVMSYMDTAHIQIDIIEKIQKCLSKLRLYDPSEVKSEVSDLQKYALININEKKVVINDIITILCRKLYVNNTSKYIAVLMLALQENKYRYEHHTYFFQLCNLKTLQEAFQLYVENQEKINFMKNTIENKLKILDIPPLKTWSLLTHLVYSTQKYSQGYCLFDSNENDEHIKKIKSLMTILKNKNICITTENSWTILHFASLVNDCVEHVTECFPDLKNVIDKQTETGLTALHISALLDNKSNVKHLLKLGCNVNITEMSGNSAAHLAAQYNHHSITSDLYKLNEFNKNLQNNAGETVMECHDAKFTHNTTHNLSDGKNIVLEYNYVVCWYKIQDLSNTTAYEYLTWWRTAKKCQDLTDIITDELKICKSENIELQAAQELVKLLENSFTWFSPQNYIRTTKIKLSKLVDMLKDGTTHNIVSTFTARSGNTKYKYLYKMICLAIEHIEQNYSHAFSALCFIAYSNLLNIRKEKLSKVMNIDVETLETSLALLHHYQLIYQNCSEYVEGDSLVSALVYVYCEHRQLVRQVVGALLESSQFTDQDINHYLRNIEF